MSEFRNCEFCDCYTNAKLRACCAQGRVADLDASLAKSIARFSSLDQSDLDPELVREAQKVIEDHFSEWDKYIIQLGEIMTPEETKAALRNLINARIKGDPNDEAAKLTHDVLQAKMQARLAGKSEERSNEPGTEA